MSNSDPRTFSMGEYLERRYNSLKQELSFKARNRDEWLIWRSAFQSKLMELLGDWPEPSDLSPMTLERVDEGPFIREKIVINSEPSVGVPAYVLLPKDLKPDERRPAILCAHGHGHGKDDVVGITHGEERRVSTIKRLNYDYARQLTLRGYITMAPDWRGFGERRLGYDFPGRDGCNVVFLKAILLGLNPLTLNIWDARRCIEYLKSRREVDGDRIGMMGLSYGGTLTLFTAALDEAIKVAVVSCYLNSFKAFALDLGNFCGSQTIPRLLKYGEMWDCAGLIAPRPLLIESGIRDEGFPIEAARLAFSKLKEIYGILGVPERCEMDEFDGAHQFSGRKAFAWFDRWL
ncbi:MAG: alpha/beta fold hydrolase [Candidatus Bathyarchaeia archaeon]